MCIGIGIGMCVWRIYRRSRARWCACTGAYYALDFLFGAGLLVKGSVIGYDDYWNFACVGRDTDLQKYGEPKAHAELTQKYHVRFRCLCGACKHHEVHQ